ADVNPLEIPVVVPKFENAFASEVREIYLAFSGVGILDPDAIIRKGLHRHGYGNVHAHYSKWLAITGQANPEYSGAIAVRRRPPAVTQHPCAFRTLPASTNAMGLCHPCEPSKPLGMPRPHGAVDEKGKPSARSVPPVKASLQFSLVPQRSSPKPYRLDAVS